MRRLLPLVVVLCACGPLNVGGEGNNLNGRESDLAIALADDLAALADIATPADLAASPDLAMIPDLMIPEDLTLGPDMEILPDLTPGPDMAKPCLGDFVVQPAPIDFGRFAPGNTFWLKVSFTNVGACALKLLAVSLSGPDANNIVVDNFGLLTPLTLAPGVEIAIAVRWAGGLGNINAALDLSAKQSVLADYVVPIIGTAVAGNPIIATDVGAVAFGNMKVGQATQSQAINISNLGPPDLHLKSVTLAGNNPGDFILDLAKLAMRIAQGASSPISVVFRPTAMGARSARLEIASDDPMTPLKIVTLSGTGQ